MMISGVVLVLGGILCLLLADRGRGGEKRINAEIFPELSPAEHEETKILIAVIRRRTIYLAAAMIIVGIINGLKMEAAIRIYGLFFIIALFWGNVVPRNRLYRIMTDKKIPPAIVRSRGIRI